MFRLRPDFRDDVENISQRFQRLSDQISNARDQNEQARELIVRYLDRIATVLARSRQSRHGEPRVSAISSTAAYDATPVAYLVRALATADGEHIAWIGPPRLGGIRTFAPQQLAERFESKKSAEEAIDMMCSREDCRGIQFIVDGVSD